MSEKGFNIFGHPGVRFRVKQMKNGKWQWEITAWREVLADGTGDTKQDAEKQMQKEAGKVLVKAAKKKANRSNLYNKLKDIVRKRPFLSVFILDAIVNDLDINEIMDSAEEQEKSRHEEAEEKLGYPPLELHALAKKPRQVALTIWEVIAELEWDRQRVDRFARDYLGLAYSNPDGVAAIEVIPLKKKKRESED